MCYSYIKAIPHTSKCRYGERGAADAKPKAQIILDAAKVSAASGGNSEPKQGQRSQSARGFCPQSTMRVPQPDIIEHFGNADAVPQLSERCLSRKAGIVRCCPKFSERSGTLSTVQFIMGNSQPPILPSSFLQSLPNLSTTSQTEMAKNARSQYRVIGLRDCKEHYRGKCSII